MEDRINHFVEGEFGKTLANFKAMAEDAALRQQVVQAVTLCVAALRGGLEILLSTDARPWMLEVTPPVLIVHGERDHLVPPAWAQRLADAIPRSSVRLLPDEGHVLRLTEGEQVLRELVTS